MTGTWWVLMDVLHNFLDSGDGAGAAAKARDEIRRDPITILCIASAISEQRGHLPMEIVTRACREEVASLESADSSKVLDELTKCLVGRDVDKALEWLRIVGAMVLLLPDVAATRDLVQEGGRRHKDVWDHTKTVVKQAVRRPAVRWAALLHDIGKVPTRTFTKDGVHFHGHAEVGARMFDRTAKSLPFKRADRNKIRFLIKHHLRSNQYNDEWTDTAVRRFARDMDPHMKDLLDLSRADITSKRPGRRKMLLRRISDLEARIERLLREDALLPPLKPGIGNAIMEHFKIPPSRRIGELKCALEVAIESGDLEERRDDAYYLEWLEKSGLVESS